MSISRLIAGILSVASIGVYAVHSQDYPSKPIRMIAAEAGGGGDFPARLIAQELSSSLGQQALVENQPGNVVIPAGMVMRAPPDGYTLLFYSGTVWLLYGVLAPAATPRPVISRLNREIVAIVNR